MGLGFFMVLVIISSGFRLIERVTGISTTKNQNKYKAVLLLSLQGRLKS